MLSFFRKKPAPQPAAIRTVPPKPVDQRERDQAITALSSLNEELTMTEGSILRLEDQKRRLLLSIEGRKAQIDALERPSIELIEKSAVDIGAELERNLAASGDQDAVEAEPEKLKEAAE
jgi:hypothetical protein